MWLTWREAILEEGIPVGEALKKAQEMAEGRLGR